MTRVQDDPISVAVISNRLTAITKEMGQIMLLTSRSPIFSESRDFVTAIFDAEGRLIAQTSYIPVLLGAIPFAMKAICRKDQNQELHPGDVIVANDPYEGNSHLPDVTIARPVFYQGQLVFWSGHTMISQLMAAGEFPLGIVYAHRVESMKKSGAPIEWVKTADPVFVTLSPVAVASKARNPNAAKLLMGFVLSREAQMILRNANRSSGWLDVEPLVPEMHPSKLKIAAIDPGVGEELTKYSKEFRQIYFP